MNTEKRFLLAIALCSVVLMWHMQTIKKGQQNNAVAPTQEIAAQAGDQNPLAPTTAYAPTAQEVEILRKLKEGKSFLLQNDSITISLSNIGGSIENVELLQFKDKETDEAIRLLRKEDETLSFGIALAQGTLDLNNYLFDVLEHDDSHIVFRIRMHDLEIVKTYTLDPEGYRFDLGVAMTNMHTAESRDVTYEIAPCLQASFESVYEKRFAQFSVYTGEKVRSSSLDKIKKKGALVEGANPWLALRKKYFAFFIKPSFAMQHARAAIVNDTIIKGSVKAPERVLAPQERISDSFIVYAGPTDHASLKAQNLGFDKTISGGWWGKIKLGILLLLSFFYRLFHNYGFAIIGLTITIKILFIPLTHQSFSSMQKMQQLQPKLKVLQDQHKGDPQKLNQATMEMYKKHKVNPLGGCLPLLLQMPIFIALYQVLSDAVELRGAHFIWWIKDLSATDRFLELPFTIPLVNIDSLNILPLLMTASMIWQQKLTPTTAQSKEQQNMMMMMPIIFLFIFYNMPSGLVIYWLLNNVLTIIQQLYTRKFHPTPGM